jgi:beta-glucanase (GH16 family)
MKCTDWSAFYLFSAQRPWQPIVASNPSTWTSEIDILETDPGAPYVHDVVTTLHKNTGGDGGVPDEQNWNNNNLFTSSLINEWHIYGCLWTQTQVTWYVDNVQVCTYPAYPSTWQPMQLILGVGPGGVNGSPSVANPPTLAVGWVRVWH